MTKFSPRPWDVLPGHPAGEPPAEPTPEPAPAPEPSPRKPAPAPPSAPVVAPLVLARLSAPASSGGSLTATYSAALTAMGRLDTPEGQLVMFLAEQLEFGEDGLSAKASLAGRLQSVWESATAGAPAASDEIDEIAKRRRGKRSG